MTTYKITGWMKIGGDSIARFRLGPSPHLEELEENAKKLPVIDYKVTTTSTVKEVKDDGDI